MSEGRIRFGPGSFTPDPSGALYWEAEETLFVADLHFEKASAFGAKGQFLPPYDTRATLRELSKIMDRFNPVRVIALGDSFHDEKAGARLPEADRDLIKSFTKQTDWIWITGNHDPEIPEHLGGSVETSWCAQGITFRHDPDRNFNGLEVCGHLHPCAVVRARGRRLRRRCFVASADRMFLPAFGSMTGSLNVLEDAFRPYLTKPFQVWMAGDEGIYPMSFKKLLPDLRGPQSLRKTTEASHPAKPAKTTANTP